MKNLKAYDESSYQFLLDVIEAKRNKKNSAGVGFKDRIAKILSSLEVNYDEYDKCFDQNQWKALSLSHSYDADVIEDLESLYKYSSKRIIELRNHILSHEGNRMLDTCQYCTIDSVTTFDHIAPQKKFPQFAVHPKNLFPACSACNQNKSDAWLDANFEHQTLNLYLDELPDVQYLFVDVVPFEDTFTIKFYLDNRNKIGVKLFSLIECHYKKLDLFNKFGLKSAGIFSELKRSIENDRKYGRPLNECLNKAKDDICDRAKVLGINHYKNVLELELCTNNDFKKLFEEVD